MSYPNSRFFYLLLLFLFIGSIQAQNFKRDSLKNELNNNIKKDSNRVKTLNDLAFYYYKKNPTQALTYVKEAKRLAAEIEFIKGQARSFFINGLIESKKSNYNESINYYNEALLLYEKINRKNKVSECYAKIGFMFFYNYDFNNAILNFKRSIAIDNQIRNTNKTAIKLKYIGHSFFDTGKYNEALLYYNKAKSLNIKLNNELELSNCYLSIGSIFLKKANYPFALKNYNKSLETSEKIKDSLGVSKALNNLGLVYKNYENYDKAIENYKKSLEYQRKIGNKKNISKALNNIGVIYINKKDYKTALNYHKEALLISEEINDKIGQTRYLNNIGRVYGELKNEIKAIRCFEKAEVISLKFGYQLGLCNSYYRMTISYINQKKYKKALFYALKGKNISNKLRILYFQKDIYELLSVIYNNIGDYKRAFKSHKKFKIFNDSLFNKENIQKITQLEYEYKYKDELASAEKRELKLTKRVRSTSQDLENSKHNLLLGVIAFLVTILTLGGVIFFLRIRNEKSKIQNIVIEQKLLRSQMTPHFIFNSLSVLQGMILNKEQKKSISYLSKFSKLLRIILENSRDKTVLLSQELTAIENYLTLQNLENETYNYTISINDTLNTSEFKIPPMLIQPFIENAIEHAFINQSENKTIAINLEFLNKELICKIIDNGIGISSQTENNNQYKKSLSTAITSERLKILSKYFKMKGTVTVEDRSKYNKKGTQVILKIPYIKERVSN
ncbi:tetratricopeptide repeat protein [uncultured Tenacibaculum sp.]|uniref:tetratricopeptide repeat protein n=1 Tax=uncultured Tenacibaculum sp. TaxID=174713 RepID=UPI0026231FE8|nr:tetratricopeptide repeat protein [uncultured Tenacibaculum sp.]